MSTIPLQDFVERYLPPNPPTDGNELRLACFQFLAFAGLGPQDIQFLDVPGNPHFIVTENGLKVLTSCLEIKRQTLAAIKIQQMWRKKKRHDVSSKTRKIQVLKDHVRHLSEVYSKILDTPQPVSMLSESFHSLNSRRTRPNRNWSLWVF